MEPKIYLPTLSHWEYGNKWSGERGRVRFLITPADGEMTAEMWMGPMARDFMEPECAKVFPVSEKGLEELEQWLRTTAAGMNAAAEKACV